METKTKHTKHSAIAIAILTLLVANCSPQHHYTKGCEIRDFPLEKVYNSTVFVEGAVHNKETKKKYLSYTGSGGVVWQGEDSTVVMTAAHVCDISKTVSAIKSKEENPDNIQHTMKVMDRKDRAYPAISYVSAIEFDACLIHVSKITGAPAVSFSKEDPKVGDIIFNIASPLGIYSSDGSPMFTGYYSGDFKFKDVSKNKMSLFSLPAAPGSSGSLLLNKNMEIVGVVSAVYTRFHHLTISPSIGDLRNLMTGNAKVIVKHFINFDPRIVVEEKVFLWGKEMPEWDIGGEIVDPENLKIEK
jgi:hypothetical protein